MAHLSVRSSEASRLLLCLGVGMAPSKAAARGETISHRNGGSAALSPAESSLEEALAGSSQEWCARQRVAWRDSRRVSGGVGGEREHRPWSLLLTAGLWGQDIGWGSPRGKRTGSCRESGGGSCPASAPGLSAKGLGGKDGGRSSGKTHPGGGRAEGMDRPCPSVLPATQGWADLA